MENKIISFILILFLFTSCIKNNPDPSWLEISPWELIENPNEQGMAGTLSHSFKEAYVTVNGKILGYFQLPAKLPILIYGNSDITIYPAVRNNGISATKKIYPFCKEYQINAELKANETVKIQPVTNYINNLFYWVEDFEDAAFDLQTMPESKASLIKDNKAQYLKYGNYYGYVKLNKIDSIWVCESIPFYNVPKQGAEVYLEIDYMTTNPMLTTLNAYVDGIIRPNPNIQLNSYDIQEIGWKKIYIDLKELVSSYNNASHFVHVFTAILQKGLSEGEIFIDNIRFVYKK
jgi:hypothetical protein